VIRLIISQYPDGEQAQKERKEKMLKLVFEEGAINEALTLIEKRDVRERL
jgi:hypothetical protein